MEMKYLLWFEFNLNNNGFEMQTYWLDIAIPAQTIYLVIAVVAALKIRKVILTRIYLRKTGEI